MATVFPAQIDTTLTLPTVRDNVAIVSATNVNTLRDAIVAVENALGIKPGSIYSSVGARLNALEAEVNELTSGSSVVVIGAAQPGQAIIWTGMFWAPGTNFGTQNLLTIGTITSGPTLSTTATTGLLDLRGKFLVEGIAPPITISNPGQGAIYFDNSVNEFLVSQDGYAFYPFVFNNTDQSFYTTGSIVSGPVLATSVTTALSTLNGISIVNGISAPSVSDAGQGIIYFDSTANEFLVSQNGGPYQSLDVGGGSQNVAVVSGVTSNYQVVSGDYFIGTNTSGGSLSVTLPSNPNTGDVYVIKDSSGSSAIHAVTINGNGKSIDGSGTYMVGTAYESVQIVYNGSSWNIV